MYYQQLVKGKGIKTEKIKKLRYNNVELCNGALTWAGGYWRSISFLHGGGQLLHGPHSNGRLLHQIGQPGSRPVRAS